MKKFLIAGLILLVGVFYWQSKRINSSGVDKVVEVKVTPTLIPSATPTIRPLTFEELNKKYGPCARVKVLMYHHIQDMETAKDKAQEKLTVTPEWLATHIKYLKDNGYTIVSLPEIAAFFDEGRGLPPKAAAITFDDAYEDNYLYAWNILKEFGAKATVFTPTGLVTVHDYLNWGEIKEMADSGLVDFGNHTWSHHASTGSSEILDKEISLADTQLAEKGLNNAKIFAYPYGKPSNNAAAVLQKYGYKLAFTTRAGSTLCRGQRFELPRIRVGNAPLSRFGL